MTCWLPFWDALGSTWHPFGSNWLPFGVLLHPFRFILAPFGTFGRHFTCRGATFCLHFRFWRHHLAPNYDFGCPVSQNTSRPPQDSHILVAFRGALHSYLHSYDTKFLQKLTPGNQFRKAPGHNHKTSIEGTLPLQNASPTRPEAEFCL